MEIEQGKGKTKHGPGVSINLSGSEVATAIHAYLVAHDIYVEGPRTITVNDDLCRYGEVYVDPSGYVITDGEKYEGSGKIDAATVRCPNCGSDETEKVYTADRKDVWRCGQCELRWSWGGGTAPTPEKPKKRLMKATIEVLVEVNDEAEAYDLLGETLREHLREYSDFPSDLIDWQYVEYVDNGTWKETDGTEFELKP